MAEERFSWTYGASEGRTIFINDNDLQDPKGNGIAAITCHRIGNEEAERLANLFIGSEDLLEACKTLSQIVRDEFSSDGKSWDKIKCYQNEINETLAVIAKAEGKEASK
jgi:hypothetical protein